VSKDLAGCHSGRLEQPLVSAASTGAEVPLEFGENPVVKLRHDQATRVGPKAEVLDPLTTSAIEDAAYPAARNSSANS
jgi:hypothetical protein